MKFVSFPSINQFRSVVKTVRDNANYHGVPLPILHFQGTVKLHGTNAGVTLDMKTGEMHAQSRERIITFEDDNAGFAAFVMQKEAVFKELFAIAKLVYGSENLNPFSHMTIFGEWCGQGIQKHVAISAMPKRFVIFAIKLYAGEETPSVWFTHEQLKDVTDGYGTNELDALNINNIQNFQTWKMYIDFANPEQSQNELVELTNAVEAECPVGKHFGHSGTGEGIVWKCITPWSIDKDGLKQIEISDLTFKVKGNAHSSSKVKTLASIDTEKINKLKDLTEYVMSENRMKQMLHEMKDKTNLDANPKNLGVFIKLCIADALKEESDTIINNGFVFKEFSKQASNVIRDWFFSQDV